MDQAVNDVMPQEVRSEHAKRVTASTRLVEAMLLGVYTCAIFMGATLIFLVQPMVAKMALPLFGGSPAVWNTSMVFFQVLLLAGYGYAHFTIAKLGLSRQSKVHLAVLLLPLLVLPVQLRPDSAQPAGTSPTLWLLLILLVTAGLPYLVVSTASPILQRWFAGVDHPSAADPYFLYAASNAGSLLALLAYPIVVEPNLTLAQQGRLWTWLYVAFVGLCVASVVLLHRFPGRNAPASRSAAITDRIEQTAPTRRQRLYWIGLAFIPSSLMVGVTGFLSTDVASTPFLWVIPLATYLLTFIMAFAQRRPISLAHASAVIPVVAILGMIATLVYLPLPIGLVVAFHIGLLFLVGYVAHAMLADNRPSTAHLTEFYLLISVGGVLGGSFNALLAPVLFDSIVEYPIVIVISMLLVPLSRLRPNLADANDRVDRLTERASMVRLLVLAISLGIAIVGTHEPLLRWAFIVALTAVVVSIVGLNVALAIRRRVVTQPAFYAVAGLIVLALPMLLSEPIIHAERTFFGVLQVRDIGDNRRVLDHGTTLHGMQDFTSAETAREPLGYYSRSGPVGQVFDLLQRANSFQSVGIVGLGTGAIAAYGQPGQEMTFFEIDPAVTRIASDERYFTYLSDSVATIRTVNGDGRLELDSVADGAYDLLIVDAFSSDSIPVHLLTREALALYRDKLTPDGALLIHISNRNLALEPVVGAIARDLGMASLAQVDSVTSDQFDAGILSSHWVVLAPSDETLSPVASDDRWRPLAIGDDLWTDEFSNIIGTLRWLK